MKTNEQNTPQHTPEPWLAYNASNGRILKQWRVRDRTGRSIAKIEPMPGQSGEEEYANAQLIAAAPDLLEALRRVTLEASHFLHGKRDNGAFFENELKNARAAIAKATGEGKQ